MPVAGVIEEGEFHCITKVVVTTFDLTWKSNVQTVFCKGGAMSDCPFLTQNHVLKGWECGLDSK